MKEVTLNSWQAFKAEVDRLQVETQKLKSESPFIISDLLFRGQQAASWDLKSTLERRISDLPSTESYAAKLKAVKAAFESLTQYRWVTEFKGSSTIGPPEDYEFMVYLRHHGFPTPLLDWTRSHYVAAFFAYQHDCKKEDNVAIFTFYATPNGIKSGNAVQPLIISCGPTIRTHQRHYLQQAEYTICKKVENAAKSNWLYANHQDALRRNDPGQDVCTKYTLPKNLREEVLADLDSMNINAYSLFASEEGLAEMLANREFGY